MTVSQSPPAENPNSYALMRMLASLLLAAIGSVGMWSVVVVLPAVQAEFGTQRGGASLPYSLTMVGFAVGGVIMGRLADRAGAMVPVLLGSVGLCIGYIASSLTTSLVQFAILHGVLIGMLGAAAVFGPLMTDISMFFVKRRGVAVSVVASGNYLAGTVWSPIVERMVQAFGWRETHVFIGITCLVLMLPLALVLHRPRPRQTTVAGGLLPRPGGAIAGLPPNAVTALLAIAGVSCCVAMSMPQVHIVAYCGDLGYGVQRGAEVLAVLLGLGIVSRIASGWILDRIGGLRTLLIGSGLQAFALALYLPFDSLPALYLISGFFGLVQGGIVPSYAIIVREHFPVEEVGTRFGIVLGSTIIGMAFGGWLSGLIFDWTGSYAAAFANGIAWNVINLLIMGWMFVRLGARDRAAATQVQPVAALRRA